MVLEGIGVIRRLSLPIIFSAAFCSKNDKCALLVLCWCLDFLSPSALSWVPILVELSCLLLAGCPGTNPLPRHPRRAEGHEESAARMGKEGHFAWGEWGRRGLQWPGRDTQSFGWFPYNRRFPLPSEIRSDALCRLLLSLLPSFACSFSLPVSPFAQGSSQPKALP